MPDPVVALLSPERLQVNPGEQVKAVIQITNAGAMLDILSIQVDGLWDTWRTLSLHSASLFPGDSAVSTLFISPPRASSALAGPYPFTVRVQSQQDPSQETALPGALEVASFCDFKADIATVNGAGLVGVYNIGIENTGNSATSFNLSGERPEGDCVFTFRPEYPRVLPGGRAEVVMSVQPRRRPWVFKGKPHRFGAKVTPDPAVAPAVVVTAQLQVLPKVPGWVFPVIGIGIAIGLAAWRGLGG
ncbi:MAG: hypothetical protein FJ316_01770 [SAR202 cluster bacterium]|nr:hypothetical protein [SAR202 cluster bacterium]